MEMVLRRVVLVGAVLAAWRSSRAKAAENQRVVGPVALRNLPSCISRRSWKKAPRASEDAIHLQDALGKPTQALESLTIGALDLYSGRLNTTRDRRRGNQCNSLPYLVTSTIICAHISEPAFKKAEEKLLARAFACSRRNGMRRGPYRVLVSASRC